QLRRAAIPRRAVDDPRALYLEPLGLGLNALAVRRRHAAATDRVELPFGLTKLDSFTQIRVSRENRPNRGPRPQSALGRCDSLIVQGRRQFPQADIPLGVALEDELHRLDGIRI